LSRTKAQPVVDALIDELPAARTRKPAVSAEDAIDVPEAEAG